MSASEMLSGGPPFEVFVIGNNINWVTRSFGIVTPSLKGFEDGKKLFVVSVIVELCSLESSREESNWMNFAIDSLHG